MEDFSHPLRPTDPFSFVDAYADTNFNVALLQSAIDRGLPRCLFKYKHSKPHRLPRASHSALLQSSAILRTFYDNLYALHVAAEWGAMCLHDFQGLRDDLQLRCLEYDILLPNLRSSV